MKRKKCYEKPLVERTHVELEDGVCTTASVYMETGSGVNATQHDTGFDNMDTSTGDTFDQTEWVTTTNE